MFTHIMVGTNDIDKARPFYTAIMEAIGIAPAPLPDDSRMFFNNGGMGFGVVPPANGEPACHANGGTIGFKADSPAAIDAWHAAGMANGGSDEGAPGIREGRFGKLYAAYLRDPDGNKLCTIYRYPE